MTMRKLALTSVIGAALSAMIVAATSYALRGALQPNDVVTSLAIGGGCGVGTFLTFRGWVGKKNC